MFWQEITPDERRNSILIPKEWYGKRVDVVFFPASSNAEPSPQGGKPFKVNRRHLESMRVSVATELLSENLIRADRDAR